MIIDVLRDVGAVMIVAWFVMAGCSLLPHLVTFRTAMYIGVAVGNVVVGAMLYFNVL